MTVFVEPNDPKHRLNREKPVRKARKRPDIFVVIAAVLTVAPFLMLFFFG